MLTGARIAQKYNFQDALTGQLSVTAGAQQMQHQNEAAAVAQGEGPSIFKPSEGHYYLMASHLTYWAPNPPMLYHAAAPDLASAKWNKLAVPAKGASANTTYNSQSASIFTLQLENGTSMFIYMGDRWNFDGPGSVSLQPRQPHPARILPHSCIICNACNVAFTCARAPVPSGMMSCWARGVA